LNACHVFVLIKVFDLSYSFNRKRVVLISSNSCSKNIIYCFLKKCFIFTSIYFAAQKNREVHTYIQFYLPGKRTKLKSLEPRSTWFLCVVQYLVKMKFVKKYAKTGRGYLATVTVIQ